VNELVHCWRRFIVACEKFIKDQGVGLPWFDRFAQPSTGVEKMTQSFLSEIGICENDVIEALTTPFVESVRAGQGEAVTTPAAKPASRKVKYSCARCGITLGGNRILS